MWKVEIGEGKLKADKGKKKKNLKKVHVYSLVETEQIVCTPR